MSKYPAHPEIMKQRMDKIQHHLGVCGKIPAAFVMECKVALRAYYGSKLKAALILLWEAIYYDGWVSHYWGAVFWFCDRVRWTKLRPIPGTEYHTRHGGKCQYHNCDDINCIEKSVPKWFRILTRWQE